MPGACLMTSIGSLTCMDTMAWYNGFPGCEIRFYCFEASHRFFQKLALMSAGVHFVVLPRTWIPSAFDPLRTRRLAAPVVLHIHRCPAPILSTSATQPLCKWEARISDGGQAALEQAPPSARLAIVEFSEIVAYRSFAHPSSCFPSAFDKIHCGNRCLEAARSAIVEFSDIVECRCTSSGGVEMVLA